jgi:probable F420-dependent oxidoreductase
VTRVRRHDQTVPGPQLNALAVRQNELDGSADAVEDLAVGVFVLVVAVTRPVRPPMDAAGFGPEASLDLVGRGDRSRVRDVLYRHLGDDDPVKVLAVLPQLEIGADPEVIARYAREIEAMGFDGVVIFDHVLGAHPDRPGGWSGPYTHESMFHEPFVLYGFLAAITKKLELTTSVIILPQRQAALVAKQAAEVDVLSGGRMRLGVGLGWNEVEYEALGESFKTRASRIEEQIDVMRKLWTDAVVEHQGKRIRIPKAGLNPLPVQRPIPLWMGGGYKSSTSSSGPRAAGLIEPALRRIARLADGWLTHVQPGDEGRAAIKAFRTMVTEEGRDQAKVGLEGRLSAAATPRDKWPEHVAWWADQGATHIELNTMGAKYGSIEEHLGSLEHFLGVARGG